MISIQCQSLSALHDIVYPHFAQILKLKTRWSSCKVRIAQFVFPRAFHSGFICWPFTGLYWNVRCVFVTCWMHKKDIWPALSGLFVSDFSSTVISLCLAAIVTAHITHKPRRVTWTVRNPVSSGISFYELQFGSAGTFRSRRCALCPCGFQSFCKWTLYWRSLTVTSRRSKQGLLVV